MSHHHWHGGAVGSLLAGAALFTLISPDPPSKTNLKQAKPETITRARRRARRNRQSAA
jgi:hypothetical protein